MANVGLYNIPEIDITYENIPWFKTESNQQNWMDNRLRRSVEAKISVDPTRTSITISQPYREIESWNIDYVCILDQSGKRLYYFVTDYEYKTTSATTLLLELDVMQTYMFDINFNPSFVERAHTNRWKNVGGVNVPAAPVLDEGIEFGDLVMGENRSTTFRDRYIISSTTPLGKTKRKKTRKEEGEYYG